MPRCGQYKSAPRCRAPSRVTIQSFYRISRSSFPRSRPIRCPPTELYNTSSISCQGLHCPTCLTTASTPRRAPNSNDRWRTCYAAVSSARAKAPVLFLPSWLPRRMAHGASASTVELSTASQSGISFLFHASMIYSTS